MSSEGAPTINTQESEENLVEAFLTDEQIEAFKDTMVTSCRSFFKLDDPDDEEDHKKALDQLPLALEREKSFCTKIINAYQKWADEEHVDAVLWDIDETMGSYFLQTKIPDWRFRASIVPLLQFLSEKFPHIKNGILSTRDEILVRQAMIQDDQLAPVSEYFDENMIYSSQGLFQKIKTKDSQNGNKWHNEIKEISEKYGKDDVLLSKYSALKKLEAQGFKMKIIDDGEIATIVDKDGVTLGINVKDQIPMQNFLINRKA